ncbi:MAG: hypothetical protein FJZ01_15690 [Candidatus Sericytochromatia bacterium]|nr:hypothetical protein [Candidatus Tanganyikabacteria bacterium]
METIQVRFLAEFLNELLACEETSAALSRAAIGRSADDALRLRLETQESECRHHARVVRDLIEEMAGEPGPATASVRTLLGALEASMVDAGADPELRRWLDLQTLVDCATTCQRNWALLGTIGECNGDPAIMRAIDRVGDDENRHVQSLRDALFERTPAVLLAR